MKAVILAGGLGTRLSEETIVKPKPLMNKQKEGQKNRNIFISEVFLSIKMIHTLNNQGLLFDWVNTS
ncbi:hypothetical protein MJI47_26800, partial [Salmonella enterica subsp. enterica serovar Kentucky]|nr:hypothetical protein [Salmonella enterica subsp. enterica serovar Kentucky]